MKNKNKKKISNINTLSNCNLYADLCFTKSIHQGLQQIFNLSLKNNIKVLDAACGHGQLTRNLNEYFTKPNNIYGCDLSTESLEFCKKMNPNINYFEQNLLTKLNTNTQFDLIISTAAFAQFSYQEQLKVFTNLTQNLKPNGFLWIVDVNTKDTKDLFRFLAKQNLIYNKNFSKFILNKYSVIFLAKKIPITLVALLEHILPGKKILKQIIIQPNKNTKESL